MSFQSLSESFGVASFFDNITIKSGNSSFITSKPGGTDEIGVGLAMEVLNLAVSTFLDKPWIGSLMGSFLVSLSGVFPLLLIHIDDEDSIKKGAQGASLKVLLSFAVGGLLGDVFLHLLPEAWTLQEQYTHGNPSMFCGVWVLVGLLLFIIVEKIFSGPNPYEEVADGLSAVPVPESADDNCSHNNNCEDKICPSKAKERPSHEQVAGYLNLIANGIDNFTHGLAVGGSFLLSPRVGALTTFAILVHEVPHEIGDFAILLRAGFSRWDAAKAQLLTGMAGTVGALTAVMFSGAGTSMEAKTSWILPFTAGGFLHISLVTVLPELLQEDNPKESLKQFASLVSGIVLMAALTAICEG
ncbi:zinc transporter ZIP13 homolog [Macrosteles quadrilineatus]|uniref:zinc transporter ZIP13 homolog n=1 Tax=Macrosteles quadrilineatus TaxID=74068 RepID=UPI0023E19080|nr:zinc transporter ZIP13 homolog [Macrosteles quadrilineatus]